MSTHADELKLRLTIIDLLQTAKKKHTYRELSSKTGLPVTVLSRYAKGHVLPNAQRAKDLWKTLTKIVGLEIELRRRIQFNNDGYFDNTGIVGDFNLLKQASHHALATFAGRRITKVLTAAVDGVPLATMIATSLGVNLIIAKRGKEVGVPTFLEETYIVKNSGVTVTLYVPKLAFRKKDSVLIVDDMIKSGETQAALVNITHRARAEVSGVFALIAIGEEWQKKIVLPKDVPIEVITSIKQV